MSMPGFSALAPAGVQSARIASLFWSYTVIATVVFVLVLAALALALVRRKTPRMLAREELPADALRPRHRAIAVATAISACTLIAMLTMSVLTSRALASLGTHDALSIQVKGHKWWWEITYPASTAGTQFTTAYEIHVPVRRTVEIQLESADVIHSFWVPSLHGKRDAIPGKPSTLVLRADEEGRYEGQCAEFCGVQHANMRFVVIAESEEAFAAYIAHSLAPAVTPDDPQKLRGQQVFQETRCITCHSIRGTEAFATVGPDLTHVASRSALAMGTLPNTPGHLAGWIADPQSAKPGVIMPPTPLDPRDLNALIAYLGSLR